MTKLAVLPSSVVYADGTHVPIYQGKGNRVNAASGSVALSATALPTGSLVVVVRSTESTYFKFGDDTVSATGDENSILLVAGEVVYVVPDTATHFSTLRVLDDGIVQVEQLV